MGEAGAISAIRRALHGKLLWDIGQNIATSILLLFITTVTTPLMTRHFPPEAYGVNSILVRAATILSAVGLLGMPIALAREHGHGEQSRLLSASLAMSLVVSVLSVSGFYFLPQLIPGAPNSVLAIFPILVLCYCLNLTFRSFGIANGLFPAMANGRLIDGLGARGLSLLGGLVLHASAMVMILADIAGKIMGTAILLWSGQRSLERTSLSVDTELSRLTATVRDYRDHATYANVATILPIVAGLVVEATIARRFGIANTGQYALAMSILGMPVALIALSSAPIIFHRLVAEVGRPDGRLGCVSLIAFVVFVGVGAACMAPVLLYGPELFAFFFGESWYMAGSVAQILALPMIFNFSYIALLGLFQARKTMRIWFCSELCSLCVFCATILYYAESIRGLAYCLAVAHGLRFAIMHFGFLATIRTR